MSKKVVRFTKLVSQCVLRYYLRFTKELSKVD